MSNSIKNDFEFHFLFMKIRNSVMQYIDQHIEREIVKARDLEMNGVLWKTQTDYPEVESYYIEAASPSRYDYSSIIESIKKVMRSSNPSLHIIDHSLYVSRVTDSQLCFRFEFRAPGKELSRVLAYVQEDNGYFNIDVNKLAKILLFRLNSLLRTVHGDYDTPE